MFRRSNVFAVIILFLTIHSLSYAFSDLVRVYDPENSTFREHCKLIIKFPTGYKSGSGCLIDSKHVITAAHCVNPKGFLGLGDEIADSVQVVPAYDNGKYPYGWAGSIDYFWWEEWESSVLPNFNISYDIAIIELDRPIGALTGWCDYNFNDNPDFYMLNDFYNPGYPGGDIFDGESMYVWGGSFNGFGDPLRIYANSYDGQSGSAAYQSGTNTIYAILSSGLPPIMTLYARITSDKYSDIQNFIASNTPSSPDLIPLDVRVYGGKKKVGDFHPTLGPGGSFDSFDFLIHNYSSSSWNGTIAAKVYVSNDTVIEPSDSLIETCLYSESIGPKESIRVSSQSSLNIPINIAPRESVYYIGVILEVEDYDSSNNSTSGEQDSFGFKIDDSMASINPSSGPNGSITPNTNLTAYFGDEVHFTASPISSDYTVDYWKVNWTVVETENTNFTLDITEEYLNEDVIVQVFFKPDGTIPSDIWVAGNTNPDTFDFSMQPDDSQSLLIPVYNPGTSSTVVNVSKSGTASSWTSLESASFTLASHELKKFQITVDSPDGVASGTYTLNISFNGIVQPISIRVADLGDDYHVNLSPSTALINGNNTCGVQFQFNNVFYDYFDISGKYQTFAQTYCDLSENQYINAKDYYLVLFVENLGATNQNLIVKMNNQPIGTITTDQLAIGEIDEYRISGGWETLTSGQNVLTFGLSQWDQSSTTPLWGIYDGIMECCALGDLLYLETCLTTSAYVSSPINLPSNVLQLINDGYMASARVYGTVTSCSNSGTIYLYNNGANVHSTSIYTSEVGDREYWSLGKSELASSNLFALKGDSSTEPVIGLSNLKLEITFNTKDPVLDVTKQPSSNRIQLGQQATVNIHIENTALGSSTGYDTDLTDSLPLGLTLSSGMLNKSNIGKLNFENTYTNTYTITANQVGHYTLPSARVAYETYDGDPVIDESMPVDLTVIYGRLAVNEFNVISPRLVNESGIHLSAIVLDVDGITPITDADVYAIVEKDFGDVLLWQVIYIVPMGWSQTDQSYIAITPAVQYGGNYRATIVAQKDWYEDGQSEQAAFYVHEPKPDITGEGVINLLDYSLLAARWLNDCNNQNNWCDGADIDHSGFVGFEDLLIMAEQWLSDSLVGYWSFDDSGAVTAIDYSGNNNDGKIYGALPISGISGQALSFDGVDDYIEFPPLTNGSKTFSFCFKTTATGVERFLSYDGGYYQDLWSIQLDSNGKVLFGAREIESGDCPQLIGSNMVNDGQWHNLVLVLNTETNESTLYIDGEIQAYSSQLTSDLTMFDHVFYGMWDNFNYNGAYTDGIIDEIRIYNRVLSVAEIQSLYQNP